MEAGPIGAARPLLPVAAKQPAGDGPLGLRPPVPAARSHRATEGRSRRRGSIAAYGLGNRPRSFWLDYACECRKGRSRGAGRALV